MLGQDRVHDQREMRAILETLFHLKENRTTVHTELVAGALPVRRTSSWRSSFIIKYTLF